MASVADYEKLGAFYLGSPCDAESGRRSDEPLLYDSKDLTTHAVIVGMTGSGKTGLAVTLLEEAAIDGIPVIAIDPKGDLGNLLLTFPELRAQDFRPWIDENDAARAGRTLDEHARATAELWRSGLADWGQEPSRIARFAESADRALYTPGSHAGRPLSVLRSLAAPETRAAGDEDGRREQVQGAVSALLGLLGIAADPIRSREHILLSTLLERAWSEGRDLDLPALIHQIQRPPVERVGVLDLESFFPEKDRVGLALAFNNLLASPGFEVWREGEPLDAARLLYTPDGRPRLSIVSIAHLSDAQRMFTVTLLLHQLVGWMRTQPGSGTLRALLYMDEVFGYLPPVANPPSKQPLLTLLKQARAFGLGVVLSTQNPADLDYKALSNAGTWFLGRLQTERDKLRVIEGLEGAASASGAGFDRARVERTLAGLDSRVFLMNNAHEDAPVVFHSRWALSYLAGPLTRTQIRQLSGRVPDAKPAPALPPAPTAAPPAPAPAPARPVLAAGIVERFLPTQRPPGPGERLLYRPGVLGVATLHYANAGLELDEWQRCALFAPLDAGAPADPWQEALDWGRAAPELEEAPELGAGFAELPAAAARERSYPRWGKRLATHLYRSRRLPLYRCRAPKAVSRPGEEQGAFRARVRDLAREERDASVEQLRRRYAPQLLRLRDRIASAEARVEREREQYRDRKAQSAISIGASLVGALFGRKLGSAGNVGRATTAVRGVSRAARERSDIARAEEGVEALEQKLAELGSRFEDDLAGLEAPAAAEPEIERFEVAPRKSDLEIEPPVLVWKPFRIDRHGTAVPA